MGGQRERREARPREGTSLTRSALQRTADGSGRGFQLFGHSLVAGRFVAVFL